MVGNSAKPIWTAPTTVEFNGLVTVGDEHFNRIRIRSDGSEVDDVNPESMLHILGEDGLHLPETTALVTHSTVVEDYFIPQLEKICLELRNEVVNFTLKQCQIFYEGYQEGAYEGANILIQCLLDKLQK